jgi:predicted nuclease of predicted toxin-antitoxin system
VKLLFDENLSRKLPPRLGDLYPGSIHASDAGLLRANDRSIWEYARDHGFVIVTADSDFHAISITLGPPPKVIWLRQCDYPTARAEALLRDQAVRISAFGNDQDQGILVLTA